MDKSKEEIEQICADIRRKMELETALGQLRWGYIGLAVVGVLSIAGSCFQQRMALVVALPFSLAADVAGKRSSHPAREEAEVVGIE